MAAQRRISNGAMAMLLIGVLAGAVGLVIASVPLYRLFCQVTGYGGTTRVAEQASDTIGARQVTVRFNADLSRDMPWAFVPVKREMTLAVGETGLAYFKATNHADHPVTGTATYNVTPASAGPFFDKIQCFCFTEQTLAPGQSADLPVSFFVDPAIADDPDMVDVSTITLSYTFFPVADGAPDATKAKTARADDTEPAAGARGSTAPAAVN
jgi:cytochrome c oxidase assembly protein subunit 11